MESSKALVLINYNAPSSIGFKKYKNRSPTYWISGI